MMTKEEFFKRKDIFEKNLAEIVSHNNLYFSSEEGRPTYYKKINKFTDQLSSELPFGYDKSSSRRARSESTASVGFMGEDPDTTPFLPFTVEDVSNLPTEVDWREAGVVTPVKNQGGCGSCWAHASTETLESHLAIEVNDLRNHFMDPPSNTNNELELEADQEVTALYNLSVQQLVSCVENPLSCGGTGGCEGATVELAYDYIINNGGIGLVEESAFPYTKKTGECPYGKVDEQQPDTTTQFLRTERREEVLAEGVMNIQGFVTLPSNDYKTLMNTLAKYGPVAVAADASGWGSYGGGVYKPKKSDTEFNINHGIVIVGYGTDEDSKEDYWIVRNSWGKFYGEDGYILLSRQTPSPDDADATCGMDNSPLEGVACANVPGADLPEKVCGTNGILFDSVIPLHPHLI